MYKLGMIIFGSIRFLSNKSNQTEKKIKKKTETGSNQPVSVRFGFLGQKSVQTGSTRFFQFGSVLARFSRFDSVFFLFFFSVWVRFGFFVIKPNRTEPVGFFKILISLINFFYDSVFSVIFFLFSQFN